MACVRVYITVVLFSFLWRRGTQNVYYVVQNATACPTGATCHQLSFYTSQPSRYFVNNTVFYFSEGNHTLNQTDHVTISGVNNITLQGLGKIEIITYGNITVEQPSSLITCTHSQGGLHFVESEYVSIKQLTITNCGSHCFGSYPSAALVFNHSVNLNITKITVHSSLLFGIIVTSCANVSITHSSFYANARYDPHPSSQNDRTKAILTSGGNVLIDVQNFNFPESTNFVFIYHVNVTQAAATGLAMIIRQDSYTVDATIGFVQANENVGSNIEIIANTSHFRISMFYVTSQNANKYLQLSTNMNPKAIGAGFKYMQEGGKNGHNDGGCLNISNSYFLSNRANIGGGMFLYWAENTSAIVNIESCIVSDNEAAKTSGIHLLQQRAFNQTTQPSISVFNLTISNSLSAFDTSAFTISSFSMVSLNNIYILHNNCTGLLVIRSVIVFKGTDNRFDNNTGVLGGGLALYEETYLVFTENSTIALINNNALMTGGGIYTESVHSTFLSSNAACFIQFITKTNTANQLLFVNNTATYAGSLLYGGDSCISDQGPFHNLSSKQEEVGSQVPAITSNPVKVCFCVNDSNMCDTSQTITISAIAGEVVMYPTISAISRWNTSTLAQVYMNTLAEIVDNYITMADKGFPIKINRADVCTPINFTFTVAPGISVVNFLFSLDNQFIPLFGIPNQLTLVVNVVDCPVGFDLSNDTRICECSPQFNSTQVPNYDLSCTIIDQSFQHNPLVWFGYDTCTYLPYRCPLNFCKRSKVNFTLSTPDLQCDLNRSGVLCGGCDNGMSLIFGSNRCKKCSSVWLLLLIPFAVAGAALVAVIMALKLTIAMGTINGLIFFANTVYIYRYAFLTKQHIPVLTEFVSWMNLDLGIETCFYNGMTSCVKTWLQFVFPAYLCSIVIVLMVISHFSQRARRLFNTSTLQTLATILLLSYTRLVQQVVLILYGIELNRNKCTSRYVWFVDGNYDYSDICHISLVVFAGALIIFFLLPYTGLLLIFPILDQNTSLLKTKWLRWLQFVQPLSDVYKAPFGPKKGFWPGLLLVVRVIFILVTVLSFDYTISFTVLECTCPALAIVLLRFRIYERDEFNFFNALLVQFMIPLLLSLARRLKSGQSGISSADATFSSIVQILVLSINFGAFIIVLLFHLYSRFYKFCIQGRKDRNHTILQTKNVEASTLVDSISEEEGKDVSPSQPAATSHNGPVARKITILDGYQLHEE